MKKKFMLIGELYHCTRGVRVGGPSCRRNGAGAVRMYYSDISGTELSFAVPPHRVVGDKLQPVAAALDAYANGGDTEAKHFLVSLIQRQERAGAAFIDFNVDQYSSDAAQNQEIWEFGIDLLLAATELPLSLDSSNVNLLQHGLQRCMKAGRKVLLNSLNSDIADWSWAKGQKLVLSASGGIISQDGKERGAKAVALVEHARSLGMNDEDLFVDPLVLPLSSDPLQGREFLTAVRIVRQACGSKIHITAGIGNCSYGMPRRDVINRAFLRLAAEAGLDAPIADPALLAVEAKETTALDRAAERLVIGDDADGLEYVSIARGDN